MIYTMTKTERKNFLKQLLGRRFYYDGSDSSIVHDCFVLDRIYYLKSNKLKCVSVERHQKSKLIEIKYRSLYFNNGEEYCLDKWYSKYDKVDYIMKNKYLGKIYYDRRYLMTNNYTGESFYENRYLIDHGGKIDYRVDYEVPRNFIKQYKERVADELKKEDLFINDINNIIVSYV